MPPPEEGVPSRKPWNLLPFNTYNSSWHRARAEVWVGGKLGQQTAVLPLTPAQLGHRGDHTPPVIRPWHQEEKLISQGPGVTDLELAFGELRLKKVQLVLPEPCRYQGREGTVQPDWQRWADTAVVQGRSAVLPQGAAGSLSCAILPAWDLHIRPQLQELGPGLGTPPAAPLQHPQCVPRTRVGCTQHCSSTSPTAG